MILTLNVSAQKKSKSNNAEVVVPKLIEAGRMVFPAFLVIINCILLAIPAVASGKRRTQD
jgi:hypothetical protein